MWTLALVSLLAADPEFSVSGTVVGPDGKPLAGVDVGPMEIRALAVNLPPDRGFGKRARSDAAGNFTLEGLPAASYAVGASTKAPPGARCRGCGAR